MRGENQRRAHSHIRLDSFHRRFNELRPGLDEKWMVMPAVAVIDFGRCSSKLLAGIGDIYLIALPARFGSVRRENKPKRALNPGLGHLLQCLDKKRAGVAHADVDGKVAIALLQR